MRLVAPTPGETRVEIRLGGADINPHLAFAATLAAGRLGITGRILPLPAANGDAAQPGVHCAEPFPADFVQAIARWRQSPHTRAVFGEEFVEAYARSRKWQLALLFTGRDRLGGPAVCGGCMSNPVPCPFIDELAVKPEWLDPNGHMNVAFYLRAVDDGSNAFFDDVGLGWGYTAEGQGSVFVTSCNMDFRRELFAGNEIEVSTRLIDWSPKLIHTYSEVRHKEEGWIAATCESLYMHISFATRRGAPMPDRAQQRLAEVLRVHGEAPKPETLNRPLGIRRHS